MARHRSKAVKHAPRETHKPKSSHPEPLRGPAEIFSLYPPDLARAGSRGLQSMMLWPLQAFEFMTAPFTMWMDRLQNAPSELFPKIETRETERDYVYRAELPCITRDQLALWFENGMIMLGIEQSQERRGKGYYRHSTSALERALVLPVFTDGSAVTAALKDGVLTIRIPKSDNPVRPGKDRIDIT